MTSVHQLDPGDRGTAARWDEFVRSAAGATFFHRAGWQTVLRDVFRHRTHFLFTEEAGRITGVLPLAHVKSMLFGQSLTSLPFAVVINRADAGDDRVRQYCDRQRIPVLAEIPDSRAVAESYSRGQLVCQTVPAMRNRIAALLARLNSEDRP